MTPPPYFSTRRALWLALAGGFAMTGQTSCTGCGCGDTFETHVSVDVHVGAGGCEMALENAGHIARYAFTQGPYADAAPPGGAASTSCSVISGPPLAPQYCFSNGLLISLNLSEGDTHALVDFLGSQSFQVTVTCDGVVVKQETESVQTRVCQG